MNEVQVIGIRDKTRLQSLIKLLLKRRRMLKTEIVKLCFLIDYAVAQQRHDPEGFTTVKYIKYYYGPYADAFDVVLNEMISNDISLTKVINGTTNFFYELKGDVKEHEILEDSGIRNIAEDVLNSTEGQSLTEIKEKVYSLPCVSMAQFGEEIKLLN